MADIAGRGSAVVFHDRHGSGFDRHAGQLAAASPGNILAQT